MAEEEEEWEGGGQGQGQGEMRLVDGVERGAYKKIWRGVERE